MALGFGKEEKDLEGYTDADGSMNEDHKALTGYTFLIDGGAISWCTKKQEIIALSTTEAEYVVITHASKEALWLCTLIRKNSSGISKVPLHCIWTINWSSP